MLRGSTKSILREVFRLDRVTKSPLRVNGQINRDLLFKWLTEPQPLTVACHAREQTVRILLLSSVRAAHHDQWHTSEPIALATFCRNGNQKLHLACRPCTVTTFIVTAQQTHNQQNHQQRCYCSLTACSRRWQACAPQRGTLRQNHDVFFVVLQTVDDVSRCIFECMSVRCACLSNACNPAGAGATRFV